MCTDFLTDLDAASETIQANYLKLGANGIIYSCETDDAAFNGSSQNPPISNKSGKNCFYPLEAPLLVKKFFRFENLLG